MSAKKRALAPKPAPQAAVTRSASRKDAGPAMMVRESAVATPGRAARQQTANFSWQPRAGTATLAEPSAAEMIDAGLDAFWELADRWKLSGAEQNALLNISDSTRLRWRRAHPVDGDTLLDRLQLILLSYQRLNEMTGSEAEAAALLRRKGSAMSADTPELTLLKALSTPSVLEMQRHYRRLEAEIGVS